MHYPWIETLQGAVAVQMAAERGVFGQNPPQIPDLLKTLLVGAAVMNRRGKIMPEFRQVWDQRGDDILAICRFYRRVASDIASGLPDMIDDLPRFLDRSNTFRMFRYDSAQGTDPESLAKTAEWVGYLEALARIEAPVLAAKLPFAAGDHVLEVGGNTGITAAELARHNVQADVLDLPGVCALGQQRRPNITFVAADFFETGQITLPRSQYDAVLFKSVLHDWPDDRAKQALDRAANLIGSRGQIVVCERGAFDAGEAAKGGMQPLANLVFAAFYREPEWYRTHLDAMGLVVHSDSVDIDMPFHVIAGRRNV